MKSARSQSKPFAHNYPLIVFLFLVAIILSLVFYLLPQRFRETPDKVSTVYLADNITPAHQKIIELFNYKHRGKIEVVAVDLPFSKFNTNERKELLARTLRNQNSRIDIFSVDQIWVPRFAKWASPLSRFLPRAEIEAIVPEVLQTCYDKNILVSIPLHIDIGVMFYRKDIISGFPDSERLIEKLKESITWEEFIQLGKTRTMNRPFYVFQGDNYEGLVIQVLEIFSSGGHSLVHDGRFDLNQPAFIQSCQFLVDLIRRHQLTPPIVSTFNESASYQYALTNNVPFFRGWPTLMKELVSYPNGAKLNGQLAVAAIPHFKGQRPVSVFGGWNLMIARHSKKVLPAVEFLKYVLSEEGQKILMETAGFLPARQSMYNNEAFWKINPDLPYFGKLIERGVHRLRHRDYTKFSALIARELHRALLGEISVEQAVATSSTEIQKRNFEFTEIELGGGLTR